MAQRRNKLEIFAEILKIAEDGAGKTEIVYNANLNFNIVRKYLKELEEAGLISQCSKNGYYGRTCLKTTEKGERYLQQFNSLQETSRKILN